MKKVSSFILMMVAGATVMLPLQSYAAAAPRTAVCEITARIQGLDKDKVSVEIMSSKEFSYQYKYLDESVEVCSNLDLPITQTYVFCDASTPPLAEGLPIWALTETRYFGGEMPSDPPMEEKSCIINIFDLREREKLD